ncbi:fatty acid desaturase [Tolypothrix sp. NIES-4075]|uniref:fatty acid desaturase family protein n=1 Tax=Tolypothrix sp. NIES-4075 TaxID=2005459 RepID=UPI000B5C6014|nr:fatty acid desaturase [Tolypothrix sp. NIES-4075]GAX44084.1 fatty acid desaturase [Tolypothrix sp. NIES-4075]
MNSVVQSKPIDFVERNNLKSFLALLRDWMAILLIAVFSIWANNIFIYLVAVWAIGIFQYAIGEVILHEAVHYNLFIEKFWNDKLEFIYGFPFLMTLSSYRKYHFPHHSYLFSDKDYIPEYYESLDLYKQDKIIFFILFVKPVFSFGLYYFFLDSDTIKELNWSSLRSSFKLYLFWLIVIFSFALSGHLDILLLYWIVPLLWCFSCYSTWSEVQEHFNTFSGSRSNVNFIINFLIHNGGYHYVHHLCPTIPWYKLPEAHKALCSDNSDISYGILDTYKQLTRNNPHSGELIIASGNTHK